MSAEQLALEAVVNSALRLAHVRHYQEYVQGLPGPYDDADLELSLDCLREDLERWAATQ